MDRKYSTGLGPGRSYKTIDTKLPTGEKVEVFTKGNRTYAVLGYVPVGCVEIDPDYGNEDHFVEKEGVELVLSEFPVGHIAAALVKEGDVWLAKRRTFVSDRPIHTIYGNDTFIIRPMCAADVHYIM